MKTIRLMILLLPFVGYAVAASPAEDAALDPTLDPGLVNPGHHEHPSWFKVSFLDLREDVAEATEADKRVILYFFQDGCPYCARLLREGFGDQAIVELVRRHFEVVAINLWGDREVVDFDGKPTIEKDFAAALEIQFTPTMLLLDEQARVVLRIDGYFPPHRLGTALRYVAERREQQEERFRDFYLSLNPEAASGKLHQEGGFVPAPLRLADHQAATGRSLVVMFEQPTCAACDRLHRDILRRETVAYALSNLDGAIVNTWADDKVQTPDGRELAVMDWAQELGIEYTPSLVFFAPSGQEVFRTEGYLESFHIQGALDYVSTGAYLRQPSFQRYLAARRAALEARGFEIQFTD